MGPESEAGSRSPAIAFRKWEAYAQPLVGLLTVVAWIDPPRRSISRAFCCCAATLWHRVFAVKEPAPETRIAALSGCGRPKYNSDEVFGKDTQSIYRDARFGPSRR